MSDDQARINIICSKGFRNKIKIAINKQGIDKIQDGYKLIMELGLVEFEKGCKNG